MADKIVVLRAGRVEQIGAPLELYNAPSNRFVAGFIGSPRMNFLTAGVTEVGQDGVRIAVAGSNGSAIIPVRGRATQAGHDLTLGIRPEHIELRKGDEGELGLAATIELLEQLGATSFLYCTLADGTKLTVQVAGQIDRHAGDRVEVWFPSSKAHLFEGTEAELALDRLERATPDSRD